METMGIYAETTRQRLLIYKLLLVILTLLAAAVRVKSDMFSSQQDMVTLVQTQSDVAAYLKEFVVFQEKQLENAKSQVADFERIANESSKHEPEHFVGNPVNAFLLIKKLTKDLQKFVDTVNSLERLKETVALIKEKYMLPQVEDYNGAITAIHRLEDTYLLEPSQIQNGKLSAKYPSRALTAFECFEMGRVAYEQMDFYHTIRWMNTALDQIEAEATRGQQATVNKSTVLDYLSYSTAQQGNVKHALELTQELLKLEPQHERAQANLLFYKRSLREQTERLRGDSGSFAFDEISDPFAFQNTRPESALGYERDNYEALCRGETLKISNRRTKQLKCRYLNRGPLLVIAPVKEEQVFDNPAIWLYHDVITESQIELMKTLGGPKLKRAIVRSPITGQYETAEYRVSKSGWLNDREHPRLNYLTQLVSAITNLSMNTAEEWQIANYGIGGQYEPHFDFARKREPGNAFDNSMGNRVATWLFYLEVPEIGGATVFTRVGARIQPQRRSAAFWYNLLPSGDGDFQTRHAACPVLFGTKWVSNKWIHLVGQEFTRPCSLVHETSEDI